MSQPTVLPNLVHMKLKYIGAARKIALFDFIAGQLDLDWPYAPKHQRRGYPNHVANLHCPDCKGEIYRAPNMDPEDIKILARQVNDTVRIAGDLKIKVKKFTKNPKCNSVPDLADEADEIDTSGYCG